MSLSFDTKLIQLHGRPYPILLQNQNGPCALIAICNLLILNNSNQSKELIKLVKGVRRISLDDIIQCLANLIINTMVCHDHTKSGKQHTDYDTDELDIDKLLLLLPNLHKGLIVNPNFNGTFNKIDNTDNNRTIFKLLDILNINLLHGWIIDDDKLCNFSYEDIQDSLINLNDKSPSNSKLSDNSLTRDELLRLQTFTNDFASQLTPKGLTFLNENCQNDKFALLFRNDHFATLYKHNDTLYTLVTDLGYKKHKNIVWETLLTVNGSADSFYNSSFERTFNDGDLDNIEPNSTNFLDKLNSIDDDDDYYNEYENDKFIARQLQEEEDQRLAKHLNSQNETFTLTNTKINHFKQQNKLKRKPIKRMDVKPEQKSHSCIIV